MVEGAELVQHLQLFAVSLLFSAISFWTARKWGFFRDLHNPDTPPLSLKTVLGAFGVFIGVAMFLVPIVVMIIFFLVGKKIDMPFDPVVQSWMNLINIIASALATFLYYLMLPKNTKLAISRKTTSSGIQKIKDDILVGAGTWLISFPAVTAIGQIVEIYIISQFPAEKAEQVAVKYLKMTMDRPILFGITAFLLVFVVPVVEEMLFRGFLQTWLMQHLSFKKAIGVTSLIFAAFHFSLTQGIANVELLISLFIFSCFLGYVYERQQSLLASIGLHSVFNGISVVALVFSK